MLLTKNGKLQKQWWGQQSSKNFIQEQWPIKGEQNKKKKKLVLWYSNTNSHTKQHGSMTLTFIENQNKRKESTTWKRIR